MYVFGRCGANGVCVWGGGGGVYPKYQSLSAGQSEIGPVSKPTFLAVFLPFFLSFLLFYRPDITALVDWA